MRLTADRRSRADPEPSQQDEWRDDGPVQADSFIAASVASEERLPLTLRVFARAKAVSTEAMRCLRAWSRCLLLAGAAGAVLVEARFHPLPHAT